MKFTIAIAFSLALAACGGGNSSPTAPSPPVASPPPAPPAPAPTIVRVTVAGVVTDANTNRAVGGATVRIGTLQATTDGNGYYSISGVAAGDITIVASSPNHNSATDRFTLGATDTRRDLRLVPLWTVSGTGNTVFDMPLYVTRVRIVGVYNASGSNFIVRVGGRLVVNEIIGVGRPGGPRYEGVHVVSGGVVEITNSRDVAWSFTQVQ